MSTPMNNSLFLKNAIFEIAEIQQAVESPQWADGQQALTHHLLLYIVKGDGELIVNGSAAILAGDSFHMFNPGTVLEFQQSASKRLELIWIAFAIYRLVDGTDLYKSYKREFSFPLQGLLQLSGSRFKRLFYTLLSEYSLGSEGNHYFRQQYLNDMLKIVIAPISPVMLNGLEARLRLTNDYMQLHYREDIRVNELAELAQLHPSYYSQLFKQKMKKTPVSYLTHLRMNKATEMLLLKDKSVRDIASDVGYKDEFYFSRRFKETNGIAPTIFTRKPDFRIISLSFPYTDHLFTLGLKPCAAQVNKFTPLVTRELNVQEHAADPWNISRQEIMDMKPDFIVCKNNVLAQAQEHINDIAPIISIDWTSKDVYTHLQEIAELVNRQEAAQAWIANHERNAERIRNKIRSYVGGSTVTLCVARGAKLRIYGARNIGHVFYRSLQLSPPEKLRKQLAKQAAGIGHTWTAIEPDELLDYAADLLFCIVESESDRKRVEQLLKVNEAWKLHPAVSANRVYYLDWEKWKVYAPHGLDQQLFDLERLFSGEEIF